MLCFVRIALVIVTLNSNRKVTKTTGQGRMESPETKYTYTTKRLRRLHLYTRACTFIHVYTHLTTVVVIKAGYQLEAGYEWGGRRGTWKGLKGGKERGKVV